MLRAATINFSTSRTVGPSLRWFQVCLCVFVVSTASHALCVAQDEDDRRRASETRDESTPVAGQRDDPHDASNALQQFPSEPIAELAQGDGELQLPRIINVPLQKAPLPDRARVHTDGDFVTLVVRDASLTAVLNILAEQMDLNVVAAGNISGLISLTLNHVPLNDALDAMLGVNGYRWVIQNHHGFQFKQWCGFVAACPGTESLRLQPRFCVSH